MLKFAFYCISFVSVGTSMVWGTDGGGLKPHREVKALSDGGKRSDNAGSSLFLEEDNNSSYFSLKSYKNEEYTDVEQFNDPKEFLCILKNNLSSLTPEQLRELAALALAALNKNGYQK